MMCMSLQATYKIDRAEVLRYLGYSGQELDELLSERIERAMERCEQVSNPGFTYRIFPVDASAGSIRLEGTTLVLEGADAFEHLRGARECAVMAATAGLANERELRQLSQLGGLDGMLFDAASSAYAEAVADACNAAIVAQARSRGLYAKWRFSPGYGDFPLDIQAGIVRVLAADRKIGVTTTDSSMLVPAKSVTAFVGLFDSPQDDGRSCEHCSFSPYCELKRKGSPCYR